MTLNDLAASSSPVSGAVGRCRKSCNAAPAAGTNGCFRFARVPDPPHRRGLSRLLTLAPSTVSFEPSRASRTVSWVLTALVPGFNGLAKIAKVPEVAQNSPVARRLEFMAMNGVLELLIVVLLVVPRTSSLGILLVTGDLGGAIVTHLESAQAAQAIVPAVVGLVAWIGHLLRVREMFSTFRARSAS